MRATDKEEDPHKQVLCWHCCTPHAIVMLLTLLAAWGCAVYFGIIQQNERPRRRPVSWSI